MIEDVLLFVGEKGVDYLVESSLSWAKDHKGTAGGKGDIANLLVDLLQKKEDKILDAVKELQASTKRIEELVTDVDYKLDNLYYKLSKAIEINTQTAAIQAVRDKVLAIVTQINGGITDDNPNKITDGIEAAGDLDVLLSTMNQRLLFQETWSASLLDNYLASYMLQVEDRTVEYGIGRFDHDINSLLTSYIILHRQASALSAFYQVFGAKRPADPKAALTRIATEAKEHIQAWNKKVTQFYDNYPAMQFFADELRQQVQHQAKPINLVMVGTGSNAGKIAVGDGNSWRDDQPIDVRSSWTDRLWTNNNQSWTFTYVSDSDKWELRTRDAYMSMGGASLVLNGDGNCRWETKEKPALFKIVPKLQKDDKERPANYGGNNFRLGIKVDITTEKDKRPHDSSPFYLDLAAPSFPDYGSHQIPDTARAFADRQNPYGVIYQDWHRIAYAKIATQSGSGLVVLRKNNGTRSIYWDVAGESYHPWYMAVTSMYVYDVSDPSEKARGDELFKAKAAYGWAVFAIYEFPELAGKTEEEVRSALVPDAGGYLTYRGYEVSPVWSEQAVVPKAHVLVRVVSTSQTPGPSHVLVGLAKEQINGADADSAHTWEGGDQSGPSENGDARWQAEKSIQIGWRRLTETETETTFTDDGNLTGLRVRTTWDSLDSSPMGSIVIEKE